MKIKQLIAGSLAALAAGATLAFGAFGQTTTTLKDFVTVTDSTLSSPMIVIGDTAAAIDTIGGMDISAAMAGYATKEVAVPGAGAATTVSGGADLATTNTKIYVGSAVNSAKSTLTSSELPTLLASSKVTDDAGSTYKYDQYITLGSRTVTFGNSGADLDDPVAYVDTGTNRSDPLYSTKVVFTDAINMSNTNVPGNIINIFGADWTIASTSTNTKLVLFKSANVQTVQEGETVTVTVGGTEHTVKTVGVSSTTVAVIEVDGVSREVTEGNSYVISGVNVYVDSVYYFGKEAQVSSVKMSLGTSKLTLENGQEVKVGEDEDSVSNTNVTIAGTNEISTVQVDVAAQDSNLDHIAKGSSFTDPVWGTFKTAFGGLTPALDSTDRATVKLGVAGTDAATVRFTDSRGYTKTIDYAKDSTPATAGTALALTDDSNRDYIIKEGEAAQEKEYILVRQGDFGRLLQVSSFSSLSTANAKVTFKDVFSGDNIEVNLGADNQADKIIDGQTYKVNVTDATVDEVRVTWGAGAGYGSAGTFTSFFPLLVGEGGFNLALFNVTNITLTNATQANITLPKGTTTGDGSANVGLLYRDDTVDGFNVTYGSTKSQLAATGSISMQVGQLYYNFSIGTIDAATEVVSIAVSNRGGDAALVKPGVLVIEEEDSNNVFNAIITRADDDTNGINVDEFSPQFTAGTTGSMSFTTTSDSDVSQAVDTWGTLVTRDTSDQGKVTMAYPGQQATSNVAMGTDPSFTTTTATGATTYNEAVPIKNPVAKFASEVNTATLTSDLILIGGPCVNTLVATLLNMSTSAPQCVTDFKAAYPTKGVVKVVEDAFVTGKKALVVAGITGTDTRELADNYVIKGTLSYSA